MTKTECRGDTHQDARDYKANVPWLLIEDAGGTNPDATGTSEAATCNTSPVVPVPSGVRRGLTDTMSTSRLRAAIWSRTLLLANRFRVVRTLDVAIRCFPERDFKSALSAAQRAMRGLVKANLLKRYRTDRFQTVYGLTQRGADWLQEHGHQAAASVRRVADMTNPEHRLWSQLLVLAAEARGVPAWSESELMQRLSREHDEREDSMAGLLRVTIEAPAGNRRKALRPDALLGEADGATWIEVDRSARGSERAASLRALAMSVGCELADGQTLKRVVVFSKNERIRHRVLATLTKAAEQTRGAALVKGRRQLRATSEGNFEVWLTQDRTHADRRRSLVDALVGHVIVQALPVWLPKLRLDGRGDQSTAGWLTENYLPYRRPLGAPAWPTLSSPLLRRADV